MANKDIKFDLELLKKSVKENSEAETTQDVTTNKTEIISVRLDPQTKEKLAYICDLEYRPMALQIRKIIEDFIRTYEMQHDLIPSSTSHGDKDYPGHPKYGQILF